MDAAANSGPNTLCRRPIALAICDDVLSFLAVWLIFDVALFTSRSKSDTVTLETDSRGINHIRIGWRIEYGHPNHKWKISHC